MESIDRAAARRDPDPALERIQREHELARALEAARTLHERLELAGIADYAHTLHLIRDDLTGRLVDLVEAGPPCQPFSASEA